MCFPTATRKLEYRHARLAELFELHECAAVGGLTQADVALAALFLEAWMETTKCDGHQHTEAARRHQIAHAGDEPAGIAHVLTDENETIGNTARCF